jgi:hypothetical protein
VAAFYALSGPGRRDRLILFRLLHRVHSEVEKIVHWMPEILFAAEIAFRGLDRCVPEQKLNLLKLTASIVAQLCTRSPQIMWRDVL